jgi:hypothetical protein
MLVIIFILHSTLRLFTYGTSRDGIESRAFL